MSADFGLLYPLWTDPHGPAELLDRAAGEIGLDHLTIPIVTGAIRQFRPTTADPPHTFISPGGWHFAPRAESYTGGSIRPRAARWFGKRDLASHVCEYAQRRGLPVLFRLAPRAARGLLEHEPHLQSRNAWGDEIVTAGACVMNPDLRQLLHDTLADLDRYGPAGFELVDWQPDLAIDRHSRRPLGWHPLARELLDLCFCPACRQAATVADIDPDRAVRSVQVYVEQLLAQPDDNALLARINDDPELAAYRRVRHEDTSRWLRRLAETHPNHRFHLLDDWDRPATRPPLPRLEAFTRIFRLPETGAPIDESLLATKLADLPPNSALTMPVWRPAMTQADQLFRVVGESVRAGITFFDVHGLEEAPEDALSWLRKAIRFARRT